MPLLDSNQHLVLNQDALPNHDRAGVAFLFARQQAVLSISSSRIKEFYQKLLLDRSIQIQFDQVAIDV